jgi:hypothetical protein
MPTDLPIRHAPNARPSMRAGFPFTSPLSVLLVAVVCGALGVAISVVIGAGMLIGIAVDWHGVF